MYHLSTLTTSLCTTYLHQPIIYVPPVYIDHCLTFSDAGICYDESEKCIQYAREGKCSTGHSLLHEDANHCKRSCGMCSMYIYLL